MLGAPQDPRFDASILSRSLTRPPQKSNGQFTDSMSQAESRGCVPKPRPRHRWRLVQRLPVCPSAGAGSGARHEVAPS